MDSAHKEKEVVKATKAPITKRRLVEDLRSIGLEKGDIVIAHFAMSKIGWIVGASVTIIDALMEVLTDDGTLVMPSQTSVTADASGWESPPVPESWWQIIRDESPPYTPEITPTSRLGRIPETFRSYPGVLRSSHPQAPFAVWGKYAGKIAAGQRMEHPFGMDSPLEKLYELNGKILLIGAGHLNNTSLHYAEFRADLPNIPTVSRSAPVVEKGKRVVKEWVEIDHDSDDFDRIGEDFEKSIGYKPKFVGQAESRLHSLRDMIDFAVDWMKTYRKYE